MGGDDRAGERTHAAEHHHDHVVDGVEPTGHGGVERADVLGEDAAGDAREERGDREDEHLEVRGVESGGAGGDLVVADGLDRTGRNGTRPNMKSTTTVTTMIQNTTYRLAVRSMPISACPAGALVEAPCRRLP